MELKVKFLDWSAGIPVVILNKETAKEIGVHAQDRISIKTNSKQMSTIVDVIGSLIKKNEIAVSSEIRERLKLKKHQKIDVNLEPPPQSLTLIKNKLNGKELSFKEIKEIISDVVDNSLSESEIALFISAMYKQGMSFKETTSLIKSILLTGNLLKLNGKFIADKHSIGGVSGRTTPIIVSICASAGLTIPKTSSRAITTPAGTADAMESLAKVDLTIKEIKKIVKKTNACIVWGGGLGMVPADSKIIQIEKMLKLDPESQLLASIMSKKLAVGSNYILIHIPYGKTAKVNKSKALRLKAKFEKLGKYFKKKLECVLVKNNGPLGNGIGPVLEMIDVIKVLDPDKIGPEKLEKESLFLSGKLLEMTGKAKKNKGIEMAQEILRSGIAFKKFKEIVKAQKGNTAFNSLQPAKYRKIIRAKKRCRLIEINNKKINSLARMCGCPLDKASGLYIEKLSGRVEKGEKIITLYSESKSRLKQAVEFYKKEKPIRLA